MNPTNSRNEAKNTPLRKRARRALNILLRSVLGGLLVLLVGGLGYVTGNLWLFPSLGPSIFMLVASPHLKSSSLYNMIVGHLIGIINGYTIFYEVNDLKVRDTSRVDFTVSIIS